MSGSSYASLIALDDRLESAGVPPLSAWWREQASLHYQHETALDWIVCAGRGSAKSTCLYKIALNETLFGDFDIPRGERHWAALSSKSKEEAAKAITIISAWLTILDEPHSVAGDVIELSNVPRGIRITAASIGGNTGWRSFFDGSDEVGKWGTEGSQGVDAREVLVSKRAMTVTHPRARRMITSSPFLDSGPFFDLVALGTTEIQALSGPTPTWIAAPHITEQHTHRLEPDPKVHAREYGAVFGQSISNAFESSLIRASIRPNGAFTEWPRPLLLVDASAGKGDSFVWALAQVFMHEGRERIRIGNASGFDGKFEKTQTSEEVIAWMARLSREKAHVTHAVGDGYSDFMLIPAFARVGISYTTLKWTNETKVDAVARLRQMLRDDVLFIRPGPEAEKMKNELLAFRERLTSSGLVTYGARNGGHDDRVALLLNLAMADAQGLLSRQTVPIHAGPVQIPIDDGAGLACVITPHVITGPLGYTGHAAPEQPDIGFRQHPTILNGRVDDYVEAEKRKYARQNAGPNDNAPGYSLDDKKRNDFGDF